MASGVRHDVTGRIALAHPYCFAGGAMTKNLGIDRRTSVLSNVKILKNEGCCSFGDDNAISESVIGSRGFRRVAVSSC